MELSGPHSHKPEPSTMRRTTSADVNAMAVAAPPGSVDETLKPKTPKKPKGWKKWKRRLSRVFKGKKKAKEPLTSEKTGAKSASKPERRLGEDNGDEDDDDEGTDESPASSEKESGPHRRRSQDSGEWRERRRSVGSSFQSECGGEEWEPRDEEEDAAEFEPEDDGDEDDEDEFACGESPATAEPSELQHAEDRSDDGMQDHEAEEEDEEEQTQDGDKESQTEEYYEEQELEQEVPEEEEQESEEEQDVEESAASELLDTGSAVACEEEDEEHDEVLVIEDSATGELVDPVSPVNYEEVEEDEEEEEGGEGEEGDCDEEQVVHDSVTSVTSELIVLVSQLDDTDQDGDHEAEQKGRDEEDDGEYEEDHRLADLADHGDQQDVAEEPSAAVSPPVVVVDAGHEALQEHQKQEELEELEESDGEEEEAQGDDNGCPNLSAQTMDLHLLPSTDAGVEGTDPAELPFVDTAPLASSADHERDDDSDVVDTEAIHPSAVSHNVVVDIEALRPSVVSDAVEDLHAQALSAEQQQQLTLIVASIPSDLARVREISAWCLHHKSSATTASLECQLFLLSVERGKWKLAVLLAEKLHRDRVQSTGSSQNDKVVAAILSQCAA